MARMRGNVLGTVVMFVVMLLGVTACGSSEDDSSSSGSASSGSTTASEPVTAPQSVKDKGFLDVAALDNYAPYTYADASGKMMGLEVELLDAITAKMGVKPRWRNMKFESMIPSVANGRNDLMVMAMADTDERRKEVDFIDVYRGTLVAMTVSGNPHKIDPKDLCGRSVAVTTGSRQEELIGEISEDCATAGKQRPKVLAFPDNSQEQLAVINGRAQASIQDPAFAHYLAEQNRKLVVLPGAVPEADEYYKGWILAKGNTELRDALLQSIDQLIQDGTWEKVMKEHGITGEAVVTPPLVNSEPATTSE